MTIENLSKKIGIHRDGLRKSLKRLSKEIDAYDLPLINIIQRIKQDGSRDTNIIEIIDIWSINGNYFRKSHRRTPLPDSVPPPPTESSTTVLPDSVGKEDYSQEDLKQQQQPGVVDEEIQAFACCLKELCLAKVKTCTSEEFDLFNESFFRSGIKEFGFAKIHDAVLNYFKKTPLKQRQGIHTPAGIVLKNLRNTQKKD